MRNLNKKVRMMVLSLTFLVAILLEAVLPIVHVDGETLEPSERLEVGESYIFDFEDGTDGEWNGRLGSETVSVTDEMAYSGDYSLKVTNRNRSHSGPTVNISDFVAPEGTYKISARIRLLDGQESDSIHLMLQHETENDGTNFPTVTGGTLEAGKWIQVSGEYTLSDVVDGTLMVYFENGWDGDIEGEYSSFYIDDVRIERMPDPEPITIQEEIPSLKDVFTEIYGDDFKMGSSLLVHEIEGADGDLLKKHFNSLTLGNELKWDATEPEEGVFNFTAPDKVLEFAEEHDIALRGHTLVWHSQTPDWVFYDEDGELASKELLYKRMKHHIEEVMGRYKGKIYAWDVVNEVFEPWDTLQGDTENGLRNSLWYQIAGEEYIKKAFEFAYEVDPEATLYINDYNTQMQDKRDAIYNLIKRFNEEWEAEGSPVRIQGVGHQTHISLYEPALQELDAMLEKFVDLGIEQQITELDMSVYKADSEAFDTFPEELAIKQAHRYRELFDVFEKYKDQLTAVIVWGKDDFNTWLRTFPVVRNNWPLLFDERLQAKYAYWALVDYDKVPQEIGEPLVGRTIGDEELIVHMDSEKDLIWQHAQELPIGDMAISKTLWNKQNLYVWIDVFDDNKHEDDKIHLFIDRNNDKSNNDQYKFDDSHYTFFRDDQSGDDIDGVESIIKEEEWGYTLVASLPVSEGEFGKKIGFDIRVESSEGKEVSQFSWNDQTQQQENNPALLGELEYTNIAKQTMAIKGTPIIDSEIDVAWEKAHSIMTEQVIEGSSEARATAKTLWDEDYLYVLVEVNDSELDQKNQLAHEQDSIEIFMDENNQKTTSYQDDDAQYRINFENATSFNSQTEINVDGKTFESATKVTDSGYIVEMRIPFRTITPDQDTLIGFDFQVNDAADGERKGVITWNALSGDGWTNPSVFGVLGFESTADEDDDSTADGDDEPTADGDDDSTAGGDGEPTADGDDKPTAGGDDDSTAGGDDDLTADGDDEPTLEDQNNVTTPTDQEGNKGDNPLPNTATSMYYYLLIGGILLMAGIVFIYFTRKRNTE